MLEFLVVVVRQYGILEIISVHIQRSIAKGHTNCEEEDD